MNTTPSLKEFTVITEPPYPVGWVSGSHSHKQQEMIVVRDGCGDLLLDGESRHVCAGDALFIPSGVVHGFRAHDGVTLEIIQFMRLDPSLGDQLMNANPIGQFQLSKLEKSRFADSLLRLQKEIAGDLPLAGLQCEALTQQLIIILLRSHHGQSQKAITPDQQHMIDQAMNWIHAHSHENILISEVAAQVGLSTVYFRQLFHEATGVSPKKYLIAVRLQASKCMLMHNRPITEVADHSGFGTPQEFSKAFKVLTGLTPSEWKSAYLFSA